MEPGHPAGQPGHCHTRTLPGLKCRGLRAGTAAARRENRGRACVSAPDVAARRGAGVNIQHRVSRQYRAAAVSGVSSGRSVIFASLFVAEFRQIGRRSDQK